MELITQDAADFTAEQKQLITDTLCKGASSTEIAFFMEVAKRAKLDPFRKQIHAVKRWDSNLRRETMTFQVGIDGLRAIAARTGEYAGSDDIVFEQGQNNAPFSATCTVWRLVRGHRVPFTATVLFAECVQSKKGGEANSMWTNRPYGQLGKCAEAAALRKGFPEETGGLYLDAELPHPDDSRVVPQPQSQREKLAAMRRQREQPASVEVEPAREAEVVEAEPTSADVVTDLLTIVNEAADSDALLECIRQAETLERESDTQLVKRAIKSRAEKLGLAWNQTTKSFQ